MGLQAINDLPPESQETARVYLEISYARFLADCGFGPNASSRIVNVANEYAKIGRTDLVKFINERNQDWNPARNQEQILQPLREEALSQEKLDQFAERVTVETIDDNETVGQIIDCQPVEGIEVNEFRDLVRQVIIPSLNSTGTAWVKGDRLAPEYRQVLADEVNRSTDFPVVALFNPETGQYQVINSEGLEEIGNEIN